MSHDGRRRRTYPRSTPPSREVITTSNSPSSANRPSTGRTADALLRRLPADVRRDWAALARPTASSSFHPNLVAALPEPARRWLTAAIAPGTPLTTTVELVQHGRIKIGSWRRFWAHQIISGDGYLWASTTRVLGLPVRGYDRLIDGRGDLVHRIAGKIAVVDESGPDVSRSAAGRLVCELCWVPAATLGPDVTWSAVDDDTARVSLDYAGATYDAEFTIDAAGGLRSVRTRRWASLDGQPYRLHEFGAQIHRSGTFGGFTVPQHVTVGYGFGGSEWPAGAFIEIVLDDAVFT
ncbi:DUF6544 family protein [Gordonia hirsuta]|nr:DUF6544 family protein [Gordonia hirsuta]